MATCDEIPLPTLYANKQGITLPAVETNRTWIGVLVSLQNTKLLPATHLSSPIMAAESRTPQTPPSHADDIVGTNVLETHLVY